jgi:tRNA (guanine37-N1)-methyltransferase
MDNKSNKIPYFRVNQKKGEEFINIIKSSFNNKNILNNRYKTLHKGDWIYFPLINNKELINEIVRVIGEKFSYEVKFNEGVVNQDFRPRSLKEYLREKIPKKFLKFIPKSYDIIGEIAIVEFNIKDSERTRNVQKYKQEIAKAIAFINKNVKTVYEKASEIKGRYRVRDLHLLFGNDVSETIHKENNCVFKLDVKKTFFTPRLFFERKRIISKIFKNNEKIVDLFAGIGPFSIEIAKNHDVQIYAFDINPNAFFYLKENIRMNKIKGDVSPVNINVSKLKNPKYPLHFKLKNWANRIIMNLPEKSLEYLDVACYLLDSMGGIIHHYQFAKKPNSLKDGLEKLKVSLKKLNWKISKIVEKKVVKPYSPKEDLIVIDAYIEPIDLNNKI